MSEFSITAQEFLSSDVGQVLLESIQQANRLFEDAGLTPPNVMIVGPDVQERILSAGLIPIDGTWIKIWGVEIRGTS